MRPAQINYSVYATGLSMVAQLFLFVTTSLHCIPKLWDDLPEENHYAKAPHSDFIMINEDCMQLTSLLPNFGAKWVTWPGMETVTTP